MGSNIVTMGSIEITIKSLQAFSVSLSNNQVHIYKDKYLISKIQNEDVVVGMKFGRFGKEDSNLIMTTRGELISGFIQ